MPRFQQFEPPVASWPQVRPAGQLRINPMPPVCTLPTNPQAGNPGVNDPYFATDADRTAWIASHSTCTPPPPFLPDSVSASTGQIKIALTPPSGASFPADLAVTVDGVSIAGSNGSYLADGLSDGPHTVKITGTGIQPVEGPVSTASGTTVAMPVVLTAVPGSVPGSVPVADCATAYGQWSLANPQPITYQAALAPGTVPPPDTSALTAFMSAKPDCAAWAGTQINNIVQQWQRGLAPVPPVGPQTQPVAVPVTAPGISWGTVLLTGLVVGGVGWLIMSNQQPVKA